MNKLYLLKAIILVLFIIMLINLCIMYIYPQEGTIANIYTNGKCIKSIDLSKVKEEYSFPINGEPNSTIISVKTNKISIRESTCPDQFCVHQGWISQSNRPIVCLPNRIVIQIKKNAANDGIDTISQ